MHSQQQTFYTPPVGFGSTKTSDQLLIRIITNHSRANLQGYPTSVTRYCRRRILLTIKTMAHMIRSIYRLIPWSEFGWGMFCIVLVLYYFNTARGPNKHTIKVIAGNDPHFRDAVESNIKYIDDDVDIDIQSVLFKREPEPKIEPPAKPVEKVPKIVGGFPKPEIEFINRKRDRLPGENPNNIRILSWTAKYNEEMEWFPEGVAEACKIGPEATCEYTSDKSLYNFSDALLIRLRLIPEYKLPTYRFSSQKWVYVEFESPVYAQRPWFEANKGIFNLTNTHSPESDIRYPRPQMIKKKNPANSTVNYAKDKHKFAAWFVSNCHTQSRREAYVKELEKYIPIDIYGQCGNKTCPKQRSDCEKVLLDYKYYLSFENSLCMDYLTEKFWRTMTKPIVGVALGAAHYNKFVPGGTYIDISDFSSPKALADHLLRLDKNDTEYNAILHKKAQYDLDWENEERHICDICQYIRDNINVTQTIPDARLVYSQEKICLTPKAYYSKSAPLLNVPEKFF